jgi:hypothetical protein
VKTSEEIVRVLCEELKNRPEIFHRRSLRKLTIEFVINREQHVRAINITPSEHHEVELA